MDGDAASKRKVSQRKSEGIIGRVGCDKGSVRLTFALGRVPSLRHYMRRGIVYSMEGAPTISKW